MIWKQGGDEHGSQHHWKYLLGSREQKCQRFHGAKPRGQPRGF